MRLRRTLSGVLVVTFIGMCPIGVLAPGALAGTLDQEQINNGGGSYGIHQTQSLAQTFTAGLSGGLDQVDLTVSTSGGTPAAFLSVEIRDVSGGIPGGMVLASKSIPSSGVPASPTWVSVTFAPPAPVVAGSQYAIVAYSSAAPAVDYVWLHSAVSNPYGGGFAFSSATSPPSTWTSIPGLYDQAFKTYVVPSPPASPSPAAAASPTGLRAAALAKCKKKHSKQKRKRCRKRAKKLPL